MELTVIGVSYQGGTIALGVGLDPEGKKITFAGDQRPMRDIALAIEAGEEPVVHIESWQVV